MDLPFPLYKYHKTMTRCNWKRKGMVWENKVAFSIIYKKYIYARNCEICDKIFASTRNREIDYDPATGKFRNILCRSCDLRKTDVIRQHNNEHKGISRNGKNSWKFQVRVNGELKYIKSMMDLEKLVEFRDAWYIEHNHYT